MRRRRERRGREPGRRNLTFSGTPHSFKVYLDFNCVSCSVAESEPELFAVAEPVLEPQYNYGRTGTVIKWDHKSSHRRSIKLCI